MAYWEGLTVSIISVIKTYWWYYKKNVIYFVVHVHYIFVFRDFKLCLIYLSFLEICTFVKNVNSTGTLFRPPLVIIHNKWYSFVVYNVYIYFFRSMWFFVTIFQTNKNLHNILILKQSYFLLKRHIDLNITVTTKSHMLSSGFLYFHFRFETICDFSTGPTVLSQ